jgi:hypothetical protein
MDRPDHPTLHFAEDEANAILRLAVELQERGASVPDIRTRMSLKDLEQVTSQIGVGPEFVREAATRGFTGSCAEKGWCDQQTPAASGMTRAHRAVLASRWRRVPMGFGSRHMPTVGQRHGVRC